MIAHRLSTLQGADRLLVFDQGRLVEQGTPAQLLDRGGLYSTLAGLQFNLTRRTRFRERGARSRGDSPAPKPIPAASANVIRDLAPPSPINVDRQPGIAWLDPANVRIESGDQGLLRVTHDRQHHACVQAVWAFPASDEGRFISLRHREPSGRETEVGMIHTLAAWPPPAQEAVRRWLARRYLIRRIQEIRQVHQRQPTGDVGAHRRRTGKAAIGKAGRRLSSLCAHGLLLTDPEGNYYAIPDCRALPHRQQRLLTLYFGD